jgi:DNA topoisomerase-1
VPKDREPASLSLDECRALLAAAPERKGRFGRRKKAAVPATDATSTDAASATAAAPAEKPAKKKAKAAAKPAAARKKAAPRKGAAKARVATE